MVGKKISLRPFLFSFLFYNKRSILLYFTTFLRRCVKRKKVKEKKKKKTEKKQNKIKKKEIKKKEKKKRKLQNN